MTPDSAPVAILAAGEFTASDELLQLWGDCMAFYCTDSAADRAFDLGLKISTIIGDMDSLSQEGRDRTDQKGIEVIELHEQDTNDLEKAINCVVERGFTNIRIFGIGGQRIDHTLANLSVGLRWSIRGVHITMFDTSSSICFLHENRRSVLLNDQQGSVVSLMPLTDCEAVRTWGMEFPLTGERLAMGVREGLSNVIVSTMASVSIEAGALMVAVHFRANP